MLVTVVEMPEFLRQAKAVMTEAERIALVNTLAADPEAGIPLGGGLRKLRIARDGGGKSGGFRSIHFYAPGRGLPVFLLTVFAKNDKDNLTPTEAQQMQTYGDRIAKTYGRLS
ncbi:type II toxin-antitoxin system RelE/ParE family toxin [Rhodobacter sp. HX-7-19]|uniref:Type II toxin-antitoxin system RelE/ParE family toxin n=1 Tax=Paragemmobacter kunshanensis TaxID=2583234 RepID=A0A6M1U9E8_9RHOB|nr:type II toxin-antitoxin system RelE/ParE family toxin [Rhodobacter kunshanensis]NGQ91031.1 type II toxin-antitoxin system RelE/ParE family toxin [Rhodobacter kunshanensis]